MSTETGYVYVIEHLETGKLYVGATRDPTQRRSQHFTSARTPIDREMQKEGSENFDFVLLERCSAVELLDREEYWIETLRTMHPSGYNVARKVQLPQPLHSAIPGDFIQALNGRPNTIKTQRSLFSRRINPYLPSDDAQLTGEYISDMAKKWKEEDLKAGTIRALVSLLRRYIKWKIGIEYDTSAIVRSLNTESQESIKAWTKDECTKALDAARHLDPELYKMMILTLHTGVRKGELFGIKWKDVDFLNGKIRISRSYDGPTKSGKPRTIPLSDQLENLLVNDYTIGVDDEHCFRRCDPNNRLAAICNVAEVRSITWHGLRHTFATLALESGVSPKVVSSALGHTKLSTTLDIYWHLTGEDIDLGFLPLANTLNQLSFPN